VVFGCQRAVREYPPTAAVFGVGGTFLLFHLTYRRGVLNTASRGAAISFTRRCVIESAFWTNSHGRAAQNSDSSS
jgi:hypothetical protein